MLRHLCPIHAKLNLLIGLSQCRRGRSLLSLNVVNSVQEIHVLRQGELVGSRLFALALGEDCFSKGLGTLIILLHQITVMSSCMVH